MAVLLVYVATCFDCQSHAFLAHMWFVHPPLMSLGMTAKLFVGHPIVYFLLPHLQYTRYKYVRQGVCNDQGFVHSTF